MKCFSVETESSLTGCAGVCKSRVCVCNCNSDSVLSLSQEEFFGHNKILPPFTAETLENGEINKFGTTEQGSSD